jgi:hypothetical protein
LDEWRTVIAELDAGVEVNGSAWSSPVRQWHGQLAGGAASNKTHPLACMLEHPSWRLGEDGCGELAARSRRHGTRGCAVQASGVVEKKHGREIFL